MAPPHRKGYDDLAEEDVAGYGDHHKEEFELQDHRRRQFIMIDYVVLDYMADIGKNAYCVYSALSRFMDKSRRAWPGWKRLQVVTGLGRDAVRKALRVLEQWGFILVRQGRRGGTFSSNLYILPDLTDWTPPQHSDTHVPALRYNGHSLATDD